MIIDHPYADCRFQLLQLRSGLSLEIHTGMRLSNRGSILKFLQTHSVTEDGTPITDKRTKRAAYADVDRACVANGLASRPL